VASAGFEVLEQCNGGLGARIDHALDAVGSPALLIGMDAPQVTASVLDVGLALIG